MKFRFELRRIEAITAWGSSGCHSLHWFGLTDGWQCLETAAGRLLEYARPFGPRARTWVDYPIVRLFEDLLDLWRWVSDPVPEDIASRFLNWYPAAKASWDAITDDANRHIDPDAWDLWCEACAWWDHRQLQFHHLTLSPQLHFWRIGDEVSLLWDATGRDAAGPRWAVQHARATLPFEEAHRAVEDFCAALMSAMAERVATIVRDGWTRSECSLDIAGLVAEQRERETWGAANLTQTLKTDWDSVRRIQDKLKME